LLCVLFSHALPKSIKREHSIVASLRNKIE
jgi:hypothetical protein